MIKHPFQSAIPLSLCLLLSGWPLLGQGQPLATVNQNPLLQSVALPTPASSQLLAQGKHALQLRHDWSNTLNVERNRLEELLIDSESQQTTLRFDYGLNSHWNLALSLRYLTLSAGQLDAFIDDFHDLFGFPQGARPFYSRDQFQLLYQRGGIESVNITTAQSGVQDLRVAVGTPLQQTPKHQSTLWFELKLPSNQSALFNNNTVSLSSQWSQNNQWNSHWRSQHSLGLLWLEQGHFLPKLQNSLIGFGSSGLSYRYSPLLEFTLQLDGHSALFNKTDLTFLGSSVQLAMGGSLYFSAKQRLDIAVVEDIQVGASPDVNFHLAWNITN
ncbi:MAG: DUF3187 family protein [Gammaproteobacteria bacterium]|nr:DUF3187 family protein [Gammaproteobacteria bacterium]